MSDAKRRTGRSIGAVAAFTLASTGLVALPAGATLNEEEGTITLDIVAISDFHGHIENAAALDNMIKEIKANNEIFYILRLRRNQLSRLADSA